MRLYVDLRTLVPVKEDANLIVSSGAIGFRMKNGDVVRCDWAETGASFAWGEYGCVEVGIRMRDFDPSIYMKEWEEIGLDENDVTPEFLQTAVGFDDIYIEFFSSKGGKEIYLPYEITCIQLDDVELTDRLTADVKCAQIPEESGYFIFSEERGFFSHVTGEWNESMDGMLPMTKQTAERWFEDLQPPDARIVDVQVLA